MAIFAIATITIFTKTNPIIKLYKIIEDPSQFTNEQIEDLKSKLYKVPYSMYIINITVPSIALTAIHAFTIQHLGVTTLKVFILMFSFVTVFATIQLIYSRKLFTNLLINLPSSENSTVKKSHLNRRIQYHLIPLLIVSILFTALLGYSRLIAESGNYIFQLYKDRIEYYANIIDVNKPSDLLNVISAIPLVNSSDTVFIYNNENYFDKNGKEIKFNNFFKKYMLELSESSDYRVYDYYGIDSQGAIKNIEVDGINYTIGVHFDITSNSIFIYFIIAFIILLLINLLVLGLFSKSISNEIHRISKSLFNIANGKNIDSEKKLAITSNDEIGDLILAFNKIQDLTKENIEQIKSNQNVLMEKERLASLGQLIGGIAHNLKTPIMSTSGACEGISDLIKEYEQSLGDPDVTKEDYHAIANDMKTWIEKIRNYTSYMSDVITAVKGQAVALSAEQAVHFTIDELVKRTDILMKHELKNALIDMNISIKVEPELELVGNINSLVQIINNMISNSIQAYEGKTDEDIDFSIYKEKNNVVISIKDYAKGIPPEVQKKLLREMVTTKGKNGTGLRNIYVSI